MARWDPEDVMALLKKKSERPPNTTVEQIAAARSLMHLMTMKESKAGVPIAQAEWNNVMDRQIGKPVETSLSHSSVEHSGTITHEIDISQATEAELQALEAIRQQIAARQTAPKMIDGPENS
jgi:DNA uptake protein ComE-like DNA-binding protein